jgi:hypothetical protein
MDMEAAWLVGLPVALEALIKVAEKLPNRIEAHSFKNEILSDLNEVSADLKTFDDIANSKNFEIDDLYRKGTKLFLQLIPIKIKLRKYFEAYRTPKEQADFDSAFNLLADLDSQLHSAKTHEQ